MWKCDLESIVSVLTAFLAHKLPVEPDGCKLSVSLTFSVNSTPIWCLGNLVFSVASIDENIS